ncbi:MAG: hypothetical protein LUG64_01485 [Clostridiales bacterium]|nr:hypothetical protein [Clostridiales bacterium]
MWSGGKRSDGNYPLLSAAIAQGLYHPRCKDSHSTWFPELHKDATPYTKEEIAELEGAERAEQRQQYAQRQAEKYRRMEKYSLDGDNQRKYGNLAGQWEQETVNRKMQEVMDTCNEMEYPYGVTLGYQAQNVKTAIVTDPDTTFAYNAKTDTLELNPANPKFADFDFTETVLHELAHRYDVLSAHSWESAEFAAALTESKKYVINNLDAVGELVEETRKNGFVQDILEILSDSKLDVYAGHGVLTEMAQKMEVFANLSSLRARKDPGYDLLTQHFPQLTKVFEHLFEGA